MSRTEPAGTPLGDTFHVADTTPRDAAQRESISYSAAGTVSCRRAEGRGVFLDAEHFCDGYKFDPDTALRVLDAAVTGGADVAVLCDTSGGMLPLGIAEIVTTVGERTGFRLGIHCQDDT